MRNLDEVFGTLIHLYAKGDLMAFRGALHVALRDAGSEKGELRPGDYRISTDEYPPRLSQYKACGNGSDAGLATGREAIVDYITNSLPWRCGLDFGK